MPSDGFSEHTQRQGYRLHPQFLTLPQLNLLPATSVFSMPKKRSGLLRVRANIKSLEVHLFFFRGGAEKSLTYKFGFQRNTSYTDLLTPGRVGEPSKQVFSLGLQLPCGSRDPPPRFTRNVCAVIAHPATSQYLLFLWCGREGCR